MLKKRLAIIFCALILISGGIYLLITWPKHSTVIFPNDQQIKVEIADNLYKQTIGLSDRKSLPKNNGMLFIFEDESKHIFWMKNTYIPLDFIWLDKDLEIVDITYDAQPCFSDNCQSYMPKKQVKYVLEVNSGVAGNNGLNIGDKIRAELSDP